LVNVLRKHIKNQTKVPLSESMEIVMQLLQVQVVPTKLL